MCWEHILDLLANSKLQYCTQQAEHLQTKLSETVCKNLLLKLRTLTETVHIQNITTLDMERAFQTIQYFCNIAYLAYRRLRP